ncbi:MAG: YdcF family protein [Clostridia bacterium]|nr:YdcF family protein [Clostridia bacterium]
MKNVSKFLLGIVGGVAGYFALTAGAYLPFVIRDARKGYRDGCDYLLVLGGLVIGEETPSDHLLERINTAAEYLKENTECFVIPCGGCFRDGQKKSEAQIIKEHLVALGIDESRFILEDKSTTTFENFENAFEIIRTHSGKDPDEFSVAFLSSDYHLHRAGIIAKRCGFQKIGKVSCENKKGRLRNYAREYFVAYELLKKDKR